MDFWIQSDSSLKKEQKLQWLFLLKKEFLRQICLKLPKKCLLLLNKGCKAQRTVVILADFQPILDRDMMHSRVILKVKFPLTLDSDLPSLSWAMPTQKEPRIATTSFQIKLSQELLLHASWVQKQRNFQEQNLTRISWRLRYHFQILTTT